MPHRRVRLGACALLLAARAPQAPAQAAAPPARAPADSSAAPCLPADSARGAVRYSVVTAATRRSGCLLVWTAAGGAGAGDSVRTFETYNDRGRGPRLSARYALDASGLPRALEVSGTDHLKTPVAERFAVEPAGAARRAWWQSEAERDSVPLPAGGALPFYVSRHGAAVEGAWLARAGLRAGAGGVALLPSGRAFAERVRDTVVTGAGRPPARVTLVAVRGLGFEPGPIWVDSAGALFAEGSRWQATIREGYEGAVAALDAAQRAWEGERQRDLARRLAHRPDGGVLVVRHARLFDAESLASRDGMTVVVRGDRIARVAPDAEAGGAPAGATVVDAGGRTLLPGLWDMHVHTDAGSGIYYLAAGVTTVRDMGNTWTLPETGRRWDRGEVLGPRLLMSGFIDGPGPYAGPTGTIAGTLPEVLAAVDRYADSGYVQIKLYSSLDTAFVAPAAARAHARGLRVSGHVPNGMTAERFVRAGADEVQHANFLMLNFLADSAGDTRTPARFTVPARLGGALDAGADSVRRFVALLRARGAAVDPTLNVFEELWTGRPGVLSPAWAPVVGRMPPQVQRVLRAGGGGLPVPASPPGMDARYRAAFAAAKALVRALYEAGVPVEAGTDAAPGWTLHRELELDAEAGIPAPAVLRLATLGAARVMRRDRDLGSVSEGKLADLVLVDGDPAARISDVRRTWLVVKGGVLYRPDELYAALGVAGR